MARRYFSSTAARTTLSASINSSVTSVTVAATTGFPGSTPWTAIIDQDTVNEEVVEVTAVAGTTLTVTRGVDGTSAVSHSSGASFNHGVSARDFDEPNAFLNSGGTLSGPTLVSVNSASNALEVRQTGAGNALVVEDSTNPDATPTIIDATGYLVTGHTAPVTTRSGATSITPRIQAIGNTANLASMLISRYSNDTNPAQLYFGKSKAATFGSETAVSNNDDLGIVVFCGSDGTNQVNAATIRASADGNSTGADQVPGRLTFSTNAGSAPGVTERMRIDSSGNVGIGTTSPGTPLDVNGVIRATSSTTTSNIQSTGYGQVGGFTATTYQTGTSPSQFSFYKYRGTSGSPTVVSSGDGIGMIRFYAYDGAALLEAARIIAEVDGEPATAGDTSDMPGRIRFLTTPDGSSSLVEAMRIDSEGNVGIGKTAGTGNRLDVQGANKLTTNNVIVARDSDGTALFYIKNSGQIIAIPTYSATVGATNRDLYIDNNGAIGYVSSLREQKTQIALQDDVSWLLDLQPVTFKYRAKDEDGNPTDETDGGIQYGLIAEDVEAVNPDVVFYDETENGPELRGVSYSKLITPLLALVQQQQQQIVDLTARVEALESK